MTDIFISYKREEQHIARHFAELLESRGWSVWWDPKINAGERYDDVIHGTLKVARCVIVIWSKRSVDSTYVRDEASYARDRGKLVPIQVDQVELPFRFAAIHTEQMLDWERGEHAGGFDRLIGSIERLAPRADSERASATPRGSRPHDLRYNLDLDLGVAAKGTVAQIRVPGFFCSGCGRERAPADDAPKTAADDPCLICGSTELKKQTRTLKVNVPKGVDTGDRIRLKDEGERDTVRRLFGDLYVQINLRPHPLFSRVGNDLYTTVYAGYALARSGGQLSVRTLDGMVALKITPGLESGTLLRLRGKGTPSVGEKGVVGDLICRVMVGASGTQHRPETVD